MQQPLRHYLTYLWLSVLVWLLFSIFIWRTFLFLDRLEIVLSSEYTDQFITLESSRSYSAYQYFKAHRLISTDPVIASSLMTDDLFWTVYQEAWQKQHAGLWFNAIQLLQKARIELNTLRLKFPEKNIFIFSTAGNFFFAQELFGLQNGIVLDYQRYFSAVSSSLDLMLARCEYELGNFYSFLLYFKRALPHVKFQANVNILFGFSMMEALYLRPHYDLVQGFCRDYDLDEALVYAVMREESHFNWRAVSGVGALGLMQIMPNTGEYINRLLQKKGQGAKDFRPEMLLEPDINIEYGVFYLSYLFQKPDFTDESVIAAYNAGPANSSKWLKKSTHTSNFFANISFSETKRYLLKVLHSRDCYRQTYGYYKNKQTTFGAD